MLNGHFGMEGTTMKKLSFILSLFVFSTLVSGAESPTQAYLRERDKLIAAAGGGHQLPDAAMAKLTSMLKKLIGKVDLEDFSITRAIPLMYMNMGYEAELDSLDSLEYAAVSTLPLLRAWLRTSERNKPLVSANLKTVFESEQIYGATAWKLATIPVTAKGGSASAILFGDGQDVKFLPDMIGVAVARGNQVFILRRLADPTALCSRTYSDEKEAAYELFRSGADLSLEQKLKLVEETHRINDAARDRAARCFKEQAALPDYFPALTRQAQALVDMVLKPGRD
jgi:hypothetical protein